MCQFLSGIGFKNGDVFTSDYTDNHENMIEAWGLKEKFDNGWVRLEYTSDTLTDLSTYRLNIDESYIPSWVTEEIKEKWERKLKTRAKRMILLVGEINCLLGGKYVVGGDVKINNVISSNIVFCGDNASITKVRDNASITDVRDNASIIDVWDNASITDVRGNATITDVRDNASITDDMRKK